MLSRSTRVLTVGATALAVGVLAALPSTLTAATASASTGIQHITPGHIIWDAAVHSNITRANAARAAASFGFTSYTATVKVGSKSYKYTIAGKNPAVKASNPASSINVELIPVKMKFSNGDSWDPTKTDSCDTGASALTRTQDSPIFQAQSWTWGGTPIGTGQVTDAYQRADFWKYAQPGGINPGFGINLVMTTLNRITIKVPNAQAASGTTPCGNMLLGAANLNWLDPYLQKTVIPSLKSEGVSTKTFPVFLLHNFVEYEGNPKTKCCVLGYHNAYSVSGGTQTYGLAMYDNSGQFSGSSDISTLSHEVAEWQNDPSTVNPTPSWGHTGQDPTSCQANLEVGDPLSGTTFADTVGDFTYHPQELAFLSWFYRQNPSLGVNGWYSDQGTFTTVAKACS
jgi:hypothetical protein